MIVGYTVGTFDLFHVGHLRLLEKADAMCDRLIVGVNRDEYIMDRKPKPIIPLEQRIEILRSCWFVDEVVVPPLDKIETWQILRFNVFFMGDDWQGTLEWIDREEEFIEANIPVEFIYLPVTEGIRSNNIRRRCCDSG
ncbi:hypothetical protein LCGC14_0235470 [marine sediment metagenome]|uniref:Cytidyltransferase-like domain-containing protein n=1 Tax=marine sediment metagenome TaxID=412755 RepID=A0A0F9WTQ7_9ZZZZ